MACMLAWIGLVGSIKWELVSWIRVWKLGYVCFDYFHDVWTGLWMV